MTDGHGSGAEPKSLDDLVVDATEAIERDGLTALDALCVAHPEQAEALRRAVDELVDVGVIQVPEPLDGDALAGTVFDDDFRLERELGRGGMGVVYAARQLSLDRPVALKVLHAHLTLDAQTIERFKREGRAASSVRGDGVVRVYAIGSVDGHHYIAMELVEGAPLDRVLEEARSRAHGTLDLATWNAALNLALGRPADDPVPVPGRATTGSASRSHGASGESGGGRRQSSSSGSSTSRRTTWSARSGAAGGVARIADLGARIADALSIAHAAGVVHRDVKPSNVLIRPDGTPVLTDFGLARCDDLPGLTRTGQFAGTPYYTAPEQADGRLDEIDARTDVFGLGATLYELLTLALPFPGTTADDVLRAIRQREPVDPRRLNPAIPDDLAAIVSTALEKDPARRYASAADFAEDLRAFLSFRPVRARRIGPFVRVLRWARREPLRAALIAVLALGVPTLTGLIAYALAQRPLVRAAEEQQALEAAEAALIDGYLFGLDGKSDRATTSFELAAAHPATHDEAICGLVLRELGDGQAAVALEILDACEARLEQLPRSLQRLRALALQWSGDDERATAVDDALGPPSEPLEFYVLGWRTLHSPETMTAASRRPLAYEQFTEAVLRSRTPRPMIHFFRAVAAGDLADERIARSTAATVRAIWDDDPFALESAGMALQEVDPEASAAALREAMAARGTRPTRILNNLGNTLRKLGDADGAIAVFEEVLEVRPRSEFAHNMLARVYLYLRPDLPKAIHHARLAVEHAPPNPETMSAHRLLIRCLATNGEIEEAERVSARAIRVFPDAAPLRRDLVNVYLEANRYEEARTTCQAALDLDPNEVRTMMLLADCHAACGDLDRVVAVRARVAELRPTDERVLDEYALALLAKRDDGSRVDAETALEVAIRNDALVGGKDPYVANTLGVALAAVDRPQDARSAFDRGHRLALDQGRTRLAEQIDGNRAKLPRPESADRQ